MSEGSRRQSTGLTNRKLIRHCIWVRCHKPPKPGTYTEGFYVDEADISVKVSVHYPGRPLALETRIKGVSRARRSRETTSKGANQRLSARHRSCNMKEETAKQYEKTVTYAGSIARKAGGMA
jgi:hypothetical protein